MNTRTTTSTLTTLRSSPALRGLALVVATTSFACEAEPAEDSPPSAELIVSPGHGELTSAEVEAVHEFAARAEAVFVGEVTDIDHQLSEPDEDGTQLPFTVVTWMVEDGIKGVEGNTRYSARFLGGPVPGGNILRVSEIPEFELGDRDLLFIEGNGEYGCPLVAGAQGRVQLLNPGDAHDGVSQLAPSAEWPVAAAASIRTAGLGGGVTEALDLDAPFEFAAPQPASPAELEAMQARHLAGQAAVEAPTGESEADRGERESLEANGFNPVLPR